MKQRNEFIYCLTLPLKIQQDMSEAVIGSWYARNLVLGIRHLNEWQIPRHTFLNIAVLLGLLQNSLTNSLW